MDYGGEWKRCVVMFMGKFRIAYRQGSFSRSELCITKRHAVSRAHSLIAEPGVLHIRIEDEAGRTVMREDELRKQAPAGKQPGRP